MPASVPGCQRQLCGLLQRYGTQVYWSGRCVHVSPHPFTAAVSMKPALKDLSSSQLARSLRNTGGVVGPDPADSPFELLIVQPHYLP